MAGIVDITGNIYGRLRVLSLHHTQNRKSYWSCECECKRVVVLRKDAFAYPSSKQKSCGCLHNEVSAERMREMHRSRKEGCVGEVIAADNVVFSELEKTQEKF